MGEVAFFCAYASWVSIAPSSGNVVAGLAHFVELFWVIVEYPLGQLDLPLDEDPLELFEEHRGVSREKTVRGKSSARQRFSKASLLGSGEGYTINNDLELANPHRQFMLAEVLGNDDALDYMSDILLGVLGALPKVVWDRARNEDGGFERDRAGVAFRQAGGFDGLLKVAL